MKRLVSAACFYTFLVSVGQAQAQIFDMTFDQFRKAFDQRIREDTINKSKPDISTTKQCKKASNVYICTFNDNGFQNTIASFKKMDILSGRFVLKLMLKVETTRDKISRVLLIGDRGDPVNLLEFSSAATNIMQLFEPGIVDGEGKSSALVKELGLMRGDDDDTTGKPAVVIKPYAAIKCLVVPSAITTSEACEWVPRS